MPSEHALLSASAAHRWLHCTPSVRLEETLPEQTSDYAEEGRLAHEIAELKLLKFITPMGPRTFNTALKKLQGKETYTPEMLTHTDTYIDYIKGISHSFASPPYMAAEKRLDYSAYAPEGFGTGDCILIGGNTLYVIDFKYGKGVPVSAEDNPQMKLYALGACIAYSFLYAIDTVKLVIVQPRLEDISESEMPIAELLNWGESIKPIAQIAYEGKGEFAPGEYCRFCRAKALCRARAEFNTSLEDYNMMKPPLITNEEVGQILTKAQQLAKWVEDLEAYALSAILQGDNIQGWKAVQGRSNRTFTDTDKAFEVIKAHGTDEAMLYERKPLTLTAIETLLGKKAFNELLTEYVDKPPGKPTLAIETDKREPITRRTAEDDFKNINENGGNDNE